MAEPKPLSQFHLGTLWLIHNRGHQPLRKGEVSRLVTGGLIEPAGGRGQFGQTHYRNTEAGKEMASRIVLDKGKYQLGEEESDRGYPAGVFKDRR